LSVWKTSSLLIWFHVLISNTRPTFPCLQANVFHTFAFSIGSQACTEQGQDYVHFKLYLFKLKWLGKIPWHVSRHEHAQMSQRRRKRSFICICNLQTNRTWHIEICNFLQTYSCYTLMPQTRGHHAIYIDDTYVIFVSCQRHYHIYNCACIYVYTYMNTYVYINMYQCTSMHMYI